MRTARHFTAIATTIALVVLGAPSALHSADDAPTGVALIRVNLVGPPRDLGLPVHALLRDSRGIDYALVLAPVSAANALGAEILDPQLSGSSYLVALERRPNARTDARMMMPVLHDDGRHIVVRNAPGRADALAELGFDLALFSTEAWKFEAPFAPESAPEISWDSRVADIIAAVTEPSVFTYSGQISGESPVIVAGDTYTIVTRHTSSGTPIQKATQFVYEFMSQLALDVSFHQWSSGRNVIGEKLGATDPEEIVLITAHLDDMPSGGVAPGADDNGSGSVAVMMAAELFDPYWFEKTVRFVFFTGEEQGLLGAQAYAAKVQADGDNIVAVYNMDMIGWDAVDGPTLRIHTRPGNSLDLAIANTFTDVVSTYGLSGVLTPIIDPDGISASDHAAFWARGYPGVLAIEDDQSDFNAYYHTVNDKREHLNMGYFTNYVKASLGTAAHLAIPTIAPCQQAMVTRSLEVDSHASASTSSNLNGILEKGERAMITPGWRFPAGCAPSFVTGQITNFATPAGLMGSVPDDGASYGLMFPGEETDCFSEGENCYELWLSPIGTRPSGHIDLVATEALSVNRSEDWLIHLGGSFSDVPTDYWAYGFVEKILHHGVTAGCATSAFCPGQPISRWQMAVFISKSMLTGVEAPITGTVPGKGGYDCSEGGISVFDDISPVDPGCRFVHFIAAEGISVGCASTLFCPYVSVDRWQMAVFLAKAMVGDGTIPNSGTVPGMGAYDCRTGGVSLFGDIQPTDPVCPHVHFLAAAEVTAGCGGGNYCPDALVTRAQMSVFLVKSFSLP